MDNTLVSNEPQVVVTQNQLMSLVDEHGAKPELLPHPIDNSHTSTSVEIRQHSIIDFLQREIILFKGTISASFAMGQEIHTVSLPNDYLKHEMVITKLEGFRFLRGTFEIRIVINAQPFQAGIMRLFYVPVKSTNPSFNSQLDSLKQMTGLSGVDVNFEDKEPIVLKIPFIYPLPSYDLLLEPDPFAFVKFIVYAPVSSNDVSYTMFCRLTNVDVSMPISQSLPAFKRKYVRQQMMDSDSEEDLLIPEQLRYIPARIPRNFPNLSLTYILTFLMFIWCFITRRNRNQNRRSVVRQQAGGEDKNTRAGGVISKVTGAISQVASTLSGIPFLTSIASPVSTIMGGVSNLASAFGWSSPRSEQITTQVRPTLLYGMNNFNRVDCSHQLALDATNKVDTTAGIFGTNLDEMCFKTLWMVPQYIDNFTVRITDPDAKLMKSITLNPISMCTSTANQNAFMTNLAYITSAFELYRGSLCFNLKVAKTNFHSLRLAIVYYNTEEEPPRTLDDRAVFNYQVVWDIRDSYQQTICIPYIQAIEWLNTTKNNLNFKTHMGYLAIYILNALQTGGTALTSVTVLIEAFAGHDFEVAIPRNPGINGYFVRPITSDAVARGQVTFSGKDGVATNIYIPWYKEPDRKVDPGETNLAIPDELYYQDNAQVISSVSFKNEKDSQQLLITDAANKKKIQDLNNGTPVLFSWKPGSKLTEVDVLDKFSSYLELTAGKKFTDLAFKRFSRHFKITEPIDNNFKIIFYDKIFELSVSKEPFHGNRITVGHKTSYHFQDYTRFYYITMMYILVTSTNGVYTITGTNEHGDKNENNIVFQVMGRKRVKQQITYAEMIESSSLDNITGSVVKLPQILGNTIGEDIKSIRQLCQRYTLYAEYNSSVANTQMLARGDYIIFDPMVMHSNFFDINDQISFFAPLYRFWSGEIRYKFFVSRHNTPINDIFTIYMFNNYASLLSPTISNTVSSAVIYVQTIEGIGEFTVPYYNRNSKSIIGDVNSTNILATVPRRIMISSNISERFVLTLYRAIGDNFSFGTKLSAPTCRLYSR